MMINKFVSSLICCLMVALGYVTAGSCPVTAPDPTLNPILATGALDFSVNLYNALRNGTTNLFFSPFSVRVALAMTAVGAGGTTLTQMNQALQLQKFTDQTQIDQAFQQYLKSFCPNNFYTLSTANRIYIQNGFPINPTFAQALNTYFMSSADNADFVNNAAGAASAINKWVANQTNDLIKNLFSPSSFSADTVLVLVNAIYFKGVWETIFKAADTKNDNFTLADGTKIEVPVMHVTSKFKYYASDALQSQVLQMNYGGSRLAMHIILPQEGVPLSTVQKNLNSQNINDYINKFSTADVTVSFPKFQVNFRQDLTAPLVSLGMVDVFNPKIANLSGMVVSNSIKGNLSVSSVIHQAYVAVDEQGTKAAAATGVVVTCTFCLDLTPEPPPPIIFNVDRPCIYFICDVDFNEILFVGNLDKPMISS